METSETYGNLWKSMGKPMETSDTARVSAATARAPPRLRSQHTAQLLGQQLRAAETLQSQWSGRLLTDWMRFSQRRKGGLRKPFFFNKWMKFTSKIVHNSHRQGRSISYCISCVFHVSLIWVCLKFSAKKSMGFSGKCDGHHGISCDPELLNQVGMFSWK